jgi:hypothetical protein
MSIGLNMARQVTFSLFACKAILMHMQAAVRSVVSEIGRGP